MTTTRCMLVTASAVAMGTMLWSNSAGAQDNALSGGEITAAAEENNAAKGKSDAAAKRIEIGSMSVEEPLPVLMSKPFPVKKAKFHRFRNLRAGQLKTPRGWNVTDWAWQAVNFGKKEIEVTWKLIADDPNFVYQDGSKGTFTKAFKIGPDAAKNWNVFSFNGGKDFPVPFGSHWIGTSEWESNAGPFYLYVLTQTPSVEGTDAGLTTLKSWLLWNDEAGVVWDDELKQFISPYANYWHNIGTMCGGWHSRLILVNRSDKAVTYTVQYYPFYGYLNPFVGPKLESNLKVKNVFVKQRAMIKLNPGDKLDIYLEDLFGWQKDWCSRMEGYLKVTPDPLEAWQKTEIKNYQVANKVTVDATWSGKYGSTLKEKERRELSDEAGVVVPQPHGTWKE